MMDYQHVGVAATFSPTFTGVFAEARRFASHCGADLEIVHAGAFDIEKAVSGQRAAIRWVEGETAASAIITAVEDFAYGLLVAGTPHRHMDDKPFAGDVAPELLRNAPCDLLRFEHLEQTAFGLGVVAIQAFRRFAALREHGHNRRRFQR